MTAHFLEHIFLCGGRETGAVTFLCQTCITLFSSDWSNFWTMFTYIFTFDILCILADAFIQSNLQCIHCHRNIWLPFCTIEIYLASADGTADCVYRQWFLEVFLGPFSNVNDKIMPMSDAVLSEGGPKTTGIQQRSSALSLTHRDFSSFSESFDDVMYCR